MIERKGKSGTIDVIGQLELQIARDRAGAVLRRIVQTLSTSERALVATLAEMYVQGCRPAR
jgi:transposase-like protein